MTDYFGLPWYAYPWHIKTTIAKEAESSWHRCLQGSWRQNFIKTGKPKGRQSAKSSMVFHQKCQIFLRVGNSPWKNPSQVIHQTPSYLPDHGSVAEISPSSWPGMAGCTAQTSIIPRDSGCAKWQRLLSIALPATAAKIQICKIQHTKSSIDLLLDCEGKAFDLLSSF